jgi:hypothetical protein
VIVDIMLAGGWDPVRGVLVDQDGAEERLAVGRLGSVTALDPVRPRESWSDRTGELGVGELVATACVRIHHRDGTVVGSGFLVGPTLVATCAHVVADALGVDPGVEGPPAGQLAIDFPMVRATPTSRTAEVARWEPIGADGATRRGQGVSKLAQVMGRTKPGRGQGAVFARRARRGVDRLS